MGARKQFFDCPVCGYAHLARPAYNEAGSASFEICPCCGVQFGYQDSGFPHAASRQIWLETGGTWSCDVTAPPPEWNAREQLRLAGLASDPVDECPYCRTPVPVGEPVNNWERDGTAGFLYAATCEGCGADLVGAGRAGGETTEGIVWSSAD
jgi:hypothetical protein